MQSRTRPRRNLWAYLLPVLVLAISFNVPKVLEFRSSLKFAEVRSRHLTYAIIHITIKLPPDINYKYLPKYIY